MDVLISSTGDGSLDFHFHLCIHLPFDCINDVMVNVGDNLRFQDFANKHLWLQLSPGEM